MEEERMVGKQSKLCYEIIGQFLRKLDWQTGSVPDGKIIDGFLKEFLDYSILTSMEKKRSAKKICVSLELLTEIQ